MPLWTTQSWFGVRSFPWAGAALGLVSQGHFQRRPGCLDPVWLPPTPSSLWLRGQEHPLNRLIQEWTGRAVGMGHPQPHSFKSSWFLCESPLSKTAGAKVLFLITEVTVHVWALLSHL